MNLLYRADILNMESSIQKDANAKRKDAKKDVTKCSLSHDITRKAAD